MEQISHEELTVWAFALRYAVSRHTCAPAIVCGFIRKQIPRMNPFQVEDILREVSKFINQRAYADDLALEDLQRLREALETAYEKSYAET